MSFGNNIVYYRKKYNYTQESLAESLNVTRQTVSRWETDSAFPEMDKMLLLCKMFNCDMDTLVRGDAEEKDRLIDRTGIKEYDRHMNKFSVLITLGVALCILGVASLLLLYSLGVEETFLIISLFTFITIAVSIFVACGIEHSNFMKDFPHIDKYDDSIVKKFNRKLPLCFSVATALILIGIIILILLTNFDIKTGNMSKDQWETFAAFIFFIFIAVAVSIFVYFGIQSSKYNVEEYNKECRKNGYIQDGQNESEKTETKNSKLNDNISSIIMISATIIYLICGFVFDTWHPSWIVFPIGGLLCAITSCIINMNKKEK